MARESTIGSVFRLEIIPAAAPASSAITAATAAKPCLLTVATSAAVKGDFLRLKGTNSPPLDRKAPHRASVASPTSITLDTDNSAANKGVVASTGTFDILTFQEVCFSEFGNDVPAPTEIDVTTMCDLERRNVTGLASMGTASFGGPMDLSDTGVAALQAAYADAKPRALIWVTRSGQTGILYGVVSSFSGGPQGVDQAVTYKGTFQILERAIYLPPLT